MKNILIFGSNGMLGNYLCSVLENNFNIKKNTRDNFDILENDWTELVSILHRIDIVINCSGIIPQKGETKIKNYLKVNSQFPQYLSKICKEKNIHLIHITTDCVFSGKKGNYKDSDNHDSETIYGISKSLGEPADATVIRTSIIGEEKYSKKSFIEWILNSEKEINGYINHYWNGVTCLQLSKTIRHIIINNLFWKGVKTITSPEITTKYQLCKLISKIYKKNINIVPFMSKDKKDMSLVSSFKYKDKTIEEQLIEQKLYYYLM